MFLYFLILTTGFAIGYMVSGYIDHINSYRYQENKCEQCKILVRLPVYTRWEYRHVCSHECNETVIKQMKIPDLIEQPHDGKIPAEGKTPC